jgi:hypothetical protein
MIKLIRIALPMLPLLFLEVGAHALWTEPSEGGYKIYFGEPGEGLREKKAEFTKVGAIKAWDAAGKEVKGEQREDHVFVKAGPGGLVVSALEAPLHGEGADAWRVRFFARTGDAGKAPHAALEIVREGGDGLTFAVRKDGKPVADAKLDMAAPGGWNRTFQADAQGKIHIEAPWPGAYVLEASNSDETPGKSGGKAYKGMYSASTYSFMKE